VAGGAAFTLTVTGTGYRTGSQIEWSGGKIAATTVVSATQLTASIPATFIATAGIVPVAVVNTDTGDRSGTVSFTITAALVRSTLSSLSPATAVAGGGAFTLTVNGTGFTSGATAAWGGSARTTTFVNATQLTASIPAADLAAAGTFAVDVVQGSGRSTNLLNFTVAAAQPMLTSLSPATIAVGSAGFDLTLTGTGFTSAASVAWNGTSLSTVFLSATQLRATIAASNLTRADTVTVDVVQGGVRSSNQLTFPIAAAQPAITSLSPAGAVVNSPAFTLIVAGTGFTQSSIVQWNGAPLTTTVISNTQLQAAVPAANLTAAATVSITVVNPASEGGASAAVSFTVTPQVTAKVVKLVSTNYQTGRASNATSNNSPPTVSQDGRYVSYNSSASDIVPGVTSIGYNDGYLADTCVGTSTQAGCDLSNTRMVVNSNAPFQNGTAYRVVSVSSDGRYVGYDTGIQEVDVHDTCIGAAAGCTQTTTEVSEVPAVGFTTTSDCCSRMSPDGRYVLYNKFYSNPDSTSTLAVYVRDNCFGAATGCTIKVTRVATGKGSTPVPRPAMFDISAGGRYILFGASTAEVDPSQPNPVNARNVWLQDSCIGAPVGCTVSYTMIDVRADGIASLGTGANDAVADEAPSFSKDGRYVVFSTTDKSMIAGRSINNGSEVYLRDTCIGAAAGCVASTTLVSDSPTLATDSTVAYLGYRSVSEHGRYVAFLRRGLDPTNFNITSVQVRDTCVGAPAGCVTSTSTPSSDPESIVGLTHISYLFPSMSADGHYVAFMSGIGTASGNGQIYLAFTGY
jgi:hypothetical protein